MNHSGMSDAYSSNTEVPVNRHIKLTTISFAAIFLLILFLGGFAAYSIAAAFPHQVKSLLISVDRFGITTVGAYEQRRIRAINRLSITFEEKQVLIKRTVFFGATRDMVELALGNPACIVDIEATKTSDAAEQWVYFIENDSKPTQLLFQANSLVSARKTSALDSCK
jgi:hypothetical protein